MAKGLTVKLSSTTQESDVLLILENLRGTNFLDNVASVILNRNKARFLKGVSPDNVKWPESESAKRRAAGLPDSQGIRRVGSVGNTLFSTSSLFESIQVLTNRSTRDKRVVSVNPSFTNRVSGAKVIGYAVQHQLGKNGLPKRQFLGVNSADTQVVDLIIQRAINKL